LLHDLRQRGGYVRESGAFLLGDQADGVQRIKAYLLFDDIDPNSLTGFIDFDGSRMDLVWAECQRRNLSVMADIHTHPGGYGQSSIDRENPMMPRRGHLGLIVPHYARRPFGPGEIGIYELTGRGQWADHSRKGTAYFSLEWF
jgi:proteasome lid subunit RPN8/RPN11